MAANIKYLGTQTFKDEYGNDIKMDMIQKNYDSMDRKGWRRAILGDLMEVIEQIGNKKIKVLEFLIDNMDGKNQIDLTQDEVMEKLGMSKPTVNQTFKALVECGFMKKINRKYVLNTNIISAYGDSQKNRRLCIEYGFTEDIKFKPMSPEEQLKLAKKKVEKLEKEISKQKGKVA